MKRIVTSLLVIISTCAVGADQPDNGVYLRAEGEPASWIVTQDEQKVFLGARQDLKIQKSELFAQDNANTRFYLSVTLPYDMAIGPSTYVLLVGGTAYRQAGSGASREDASSLSFYISGEDNAKEVSKYLAVPLRYRTHPRHTLLVSFTPAKHDFDPGEEVTATFHIKNIGTNTVSFMKGGRNRAARDNQYVFSARHRGKQVEDIGTSFHHGGIAVRRVLKQDDVFEDTISLNKWFSFGTPGSYEIHGSYYLDFNDPESESWRTIWEDYVSADFMVTVNQPKELSNNQVDATR